MGGRRFQVNLAFIAFNGQPLFKIYTSQAIGRLQAEELLE
jgi:hypothetical protein